MNDFHILLAMAANTTGICQALNLTDETKCTELATNVNGLFFQYHARRAQGMYSGYKRRNARLDALNAAQPRYLASSKLTLRNEDFSGIEDSEELRTLEDFLYEKYRLLEEVVTARRKHMHVFMPRTWIMGTSPTWTSW